MCFCLIVGFFGISLFIWCVVFLNFCVIFWNIYFNLCIYCFCLEFVLFNSGFWDNVGKLVFCIVYRNVLCFVFGVVCCKNWMVYVLYWYGVFSEFIFIDKRFLCYVCDLSFFGFVDEGGFDYCKNVVWMLMIMLCV